MTRPTVAVAIHDGFYGAGTGAGYANRAFLSVLADSLAPHVRLVVLPVRVSAESTEYDATWHQQTLALLERATGEARPEVRPVDNGTNGMARFGGLAEFRQLGLATAAALREQLPAAADSAVILFDVPFLGVPPLLPPALLPQVTVVPRSTSLLHDPGHSDRVRFELYGLISTALHGGKVAAISGHMRTHLTTAYNIPNTALIDLPDGLTAAEQRFGTPDDNLLPGRGRGGFLLAMGRAQPYKGWDDLIQALAILQRTETPTPHAVLAAVTEDKHPSPYQRHLIHTVNELGLNATVITRFSPAIRDLLTHPQLRAVIVPSRIEPFGRIPIEAYAAGAAPVIATSAGGLAEQILDSVTGLLAAPCDPPSLADAITRGLSLQRAELEQMRSAGRQLLATRYNHALAVRRFLTDIAPWAQRRTPEPIPATNRS